MKPIKINPLIRMILIWSSRHLFKAEVFSFTRKLMESKKILICMPASIERFAIANDSLPVFAEIFQGKTVFVLLPFLKTDGYLPVPTGYDVIYPRKEELKIFSLPGKKFIQRLREHQFDISLNLDLDDGFFNGYLCLKCKTPVRIGLQRKNGFPLDNIQLVVGQEESNNKEVYEKIAKMLKDLLVYRKET